MILLIIIIIASIAAYLSVMAGVIAYAGRRYGQAEHALSKIDKYRDHSQMHIRSEWSKADSKVWAWKVTALWAPLWPAVMIVYGVRSLYRGIDIGIKFIAHGLFTSQAEHAREIEKRKEAEVISIEKAAA